MQQGISTIAYIRITPGPERPQTQGLEGQERRLRAFAQIKRFGVIEIVSEVAPADDPAREGIRRLLQLCKIQKRRILCIAPYILAINPEKRAIIEGQLQTTGAVIEYLFPKMEKDPAMFRREHQ